MKQNTTTLWYDTPAEIWVEALPIGNGRLGAMVFGRTGTERIQLNEQTIWTGGPYDPTRPGGPEALPEIRRLVFEGKCFEAEELFGKTMMGQPAEQLKYQPLGNLTLEFPDHANATGYRRELDLDTAIAGASYQVGGTTFRREVFASPIDQVIVVRVSADKPGSISFTAKLDGVCNVKKAEDEKLTAQGSAAWFGTTVAPDDEYSTAVLNDGVLLLRGKTSSDEGIEGRIRYEARVQILNEGGKLIVGKDAVSVNGANAVTLLIAAATNFKRYDDLTGNPEARVLAYFQSVTGKSFQQLRADHVAEHQRLFRRVALELPSTAASKRPTDERVRSYDPAKDPELMVLLFQYGRYLLISSSRPGCQPPNLQGIWNEDINPSWESKFTTNINLQMNYWPAENTALSECVEPLVQMVKELAETGSKVARVHYGARGWVFHQNTDQWRHAAPMDGPTWGTFMVGGAWLCIHLWEHYLFNGDESYLRDVYPLFKGCAQFFLDTLIEHPTHKWLVTCPSNSPENFPACPGNKPYHSIFHNSEMPGTTICAGATMDMQILRDLFGACIEAGKILKIDKDFCDEVERTRQRLAPMQVGRQGNLQEWLEDWGDLEPKHRHISHLYGLFPSNQISLVTTPKLAAAAKVTLEQRGEVTISSRGVPGTGFSMAWKAACWARLLDGDHANLCLKTLVTHQICPNLFSRCFTPPQVDGTFGAAAAIAEMLLQSHAGEIHLLPALPKAWLTGKVTGLRARGGYTVDIEWKNGNVTSYHIASTQPREIKVRINGELKTVTTEKI